MQALFAVDGRHRNTDVAPLTRKRVAIGRCKVFGAAVLRKDDLSLVLAETNERFPALARQS